MAMTKLEKINKQIKASTEKYFTKSGTARKTTTTEQLEEFDALKSERDRLEAQNAADPVVKKSLTTEKAVKADERFSDVDELPGTEGKSAEDVRMNQVPSTYVTLNVGGKSISRPYYGQRSANRKGK